MRCRQFSLAIHPADGILQTHWRRHPSLIRFGARRPKLHACSPKNPTLRHSPLLSMNLDTERAFGGVACVCVRVCGGIGGLFAIRPRYYIQLGNAFSNSRSDFAIVSIRGDLRGGNILVRNILNLLDECSAIHPLGCPRPPEKRRFHRGT